MRIPVLAYHAVNIDGNDYANNDHVAFAADLRLIDQLGLRIVPLHWVIDQLLGRARRDLSHCVVLTCDDGSDFDFHDLDHPVHGPQRSLFNCMNDFAAEFGASAQSDLHLTSFVIASIDARLHIDRGCLADRGWMSDAWWNVAIASGRMAIENHSLDHNHLAIPTEGIDGMPRGAFHEVNSYARADAQIAAATRIIDARIAPARTRVFCYPYGHVPAYVHDEYLPQHGDEHGMLAAMGDGARPIDAHSDRWNLPRYICGWHWKSPDELERILRTN